MDPIPEDDLWPLLDRYVSGDASPADIERVDAWLAADPSRPAILADLRRVRDVVARRPPQRSVDAAWRAVARATHIDHGPRHIAPRRAPRVTAGRPQWMAAAAVVLLFASAAVGLTIASSRHAARQPVVPVAAAHVYNTERGQRAEVRLVDGTRVTLAPASRLVVPADFDIARREVTLEGRAMLTVVHNEQRPFIVRAKTAVALDVGTRFDIRAYPEDADVVVVVTEGIVQLRDSSAPPSTAVVMKRGSVGRVQRDGTTSLRQSVNTDRLTAWTEGTLNFADTPLPSALAELARWYDLDVRIADSALVTRRVTATLGDQALPDMLELFAIGLRARVERQGRRVTFHATDAPSATK